MPISLVFAASVFLWMILRVVMVCTDRRADLRLASGWYVLPSAICMLTLVAALTLWALA